MTRLRMAAPLLAAAALAAVAVATVRGAGCEDPGQLVPLASGGYEYVGTCVTAGDVLVTGPLVDDPLATDPPPASSERAPITDENGMLKS